MNDIPVGPWLRSVFLDIVPALSILILIALTTLPVGVVPHLRLGGLLPLVGISYWSLVRPRSMRLAVVFLLGLVTDIILFAPLGVHAFIFILSQLVLRKQRRFLAGQGFWVLWAAFALLIFGAWLLSWVAMAALSGSMIPFVKNLFAAAIAWAAVPLLAGVLSMLNETIDLFDEPIP